MRRHALLLLILVMLFSCIPVNAAKLMAVKPVSAELSFSGTTATCKVVVSSQKASYPVSVTVTLMQGNTVIKSWNNISGTGYLSFSDSVSVTKGYSYTMKTTVKINGSSYSVSDITKSCN